MRKYTVNYRAELYGKYTQSSLLMHAQEDWIAEDKAPNEVRAEVAKKYGYSSDHECSVKVWIDKITYEGEVTAAERIGTFIIGIGILFGIGFLISLACIIFGFTWLGLWLTLGCGAASLLCFFIGYKISS